MGRRLKLLEPLPVFGIDTSKPGAYVASRASTNSQNVRVKRSLVQTRPGTEALGSSLGERVQLMSELDTGSATFFLRFGLTKVELLNKSALTWSSVAHAVLTGAAANRISVAFPLLSDERIMAFTNGVDAIRKYDGSGPDADLGGTPPKAKFMLFYGGYLILAYITDGGDVFPWRVQWPDTGDPETWSGGNAGSAELLEDSADITGMGYFGQYFTIHKENAIYVGYLTQSSGVFNFERRETGAGAIANGTIQSLPTGEQIFLARDGLRVFNGNTAPLVESPIVDEIRDYLNPEYAYKSWSKIVRESDEYIVGVPLGNQTEPETIFKFNYVTRQIHKDIRTGVTACADYKNTVGQRSWNDVPNSFDSDVAIWNDIALASLNPITAFGFSDGATTRQNTSSSDVGEPIDSSWDSRDFSAKDYELPENLLMEWQGVQLWCKGNGSLEVLYSTDGGSTWNTTGTITLSSEFPDDFSPQMVYFNAISSRLRVRLRNQNDAEQFSMEQFAPVAVSREEYGI